MFSWKVLVLEVPQKTCAHPFVGHHLTYPLYYPYIFHSIIWNPLATTLTVLFPHYISFTYFLNPLATTFTSHLIFSWHSPYLLEPNITLRNLMTKVQLQLASLQNKKTCQKHLCACQPSGQAWRRKLWFEPVISSKEIKIQQIWFDQYLIKKYQWKNQKN